VKILHVIPAVAVRYGGPSQAVKEMCHALMQRGVEIELATTNANLNSNLDVPLGEKILYREIPTFFFPRTLKTEYKFSWSLNRWLKKNVKNYDLLHIHSIFCYPTAVAAHYANRVKIPYIIRPAGMLDRWPMKQKKIRKTLYLNWIEKKSLRGAAAIHYTSEKEKLASERFRFLSPGVVIPLGVHVDSKYGKIEKGSFRKKYPVCQDKKLVVFLSRLDPKKGLHFLIQAFSKILRIQDDVILVIAGQGEPNYDTFVRKEAETNLNKKVIFTGFLDDEEKYVLFKDADIFVLPSYQENFGLAVAEAMGAGLPVVVSGQVGISPDIEKYGAGIIIKCSADSLAEGIEKLIRDPSLCQQMGQRGQQLVRERFSWDKAADQLVNLYDNILTRRI